MKPTEKEIRLHLSVHRVHQEIRVQGCEGLSFNRVGEGQHQQFSFPGYHELGKAVKSFDRDYIERCVRGSGEVEAAIGKLLENIPKILHNTIGR